jgi:hypothetical protein
VVITGMTVNVGVITVFGKFQCLLLSLVGNTHL